jgi:hypothetical protein
MQCAVERRRRRRGSGDDSSISDADVTGQHAFSRGVRADYSALPVDQHGRRKAGLERIKGRGGTRPPQRSRDRDTAWQCVHEPRKAPFLFRREGLLIHLPLDREDP